MEKEKFVINKKQLNAEELKTGKVSYGRIIKRYTDNELVLCNNIVDIDNSIWENIKNNGFYNDDDNDDADLEVYQYFLCNLNDDEIEALTQAGVIVSYSDKLDLNVIMVTHFGTSWDYVMTDVEWVDIDEYYR